MIHIYMTYMDCEVFAPCQSLFAMHLILYRLFTVLKLHKTVLKTLVNCNFPSFSAICISHSFCDDDIFENYLIFAQSSLVTFYTH